MPILTKSKNTSTKKKANGLLEYMFLANIEAVGLSISFVLATVITGIYISFNQVNPTKNVEITNHKSSIIN